MTGALATMRPQRHSYPNRLRASGRHWDKLSFDRRAHRRLGLQAFRSSASSHYHASPRQQTAVRFGRVGAHGIIAIGIGAHGIIAIGVSAHGIIAIAIIPMGVISVGGVSMGILTAGGVSMGIVTASPMGMGMREFPRNDATLPSEPSSWQPLIPQAGTAAAAAPAQPVAPGQALGTVLPLLGALGARLLGRWLRAYRPLGSRE